jgi:hypothetical protein
MAMGQAAGVTAALGAARGGEVRAATAGAVRDRLRGDGAILSMDDLP